MPRAEAAPTRAILLALERRIVAVEEATVFAILVLLLVTLTLQVASRFLFEFPLDWTEELARVAQLWLVFIGAAVGAHRAEHQSLRAGRSGAARSSLDRLGHSGMGCGGGCASDPTALTSPRYQVEEPRLS